MDVSIRRKASGKTEKAWNLKEMLGVGEKDTAAGFERWAQEQSNRN